MKQYGAVIEVMRNNGGFATLGHLYSEVLKVPNVKWGTKTPFASIRRIVQDNRFFFKIKPGLWALKDMESKLPFSDNIKGSQKIRTEFDHTYYQGLLVEIGNLRGFRTTVPNQDKNKIYLDKILANIVTIKTFYKFTYENIIQRARTIDVVWFNIRKYPNSVFEVEHSTDIQNSLLKFLELQDFNTTFKIVAPDVRKGEYLRKLSYEAFRPIKDRVGFLNYTTLSNLHSKEHELQLIENNW